MKRKFKKEKHEMKDWIKNSRIVEREGHIEVEEKKEVKV